MRNLNFRQTLDLYRAGELSDTQLVEEVERQIVSGGLNPTWALAELEDAHVSAPLPEMVHSELVRLFHHGAATTDPTRPLIDLTAVGPPFHWRRPVLALGTVLRSRFQLVERIGEGGMSTVYKAVDLRKVEGRVSDTYVAVKILSVHVTDLTRSLEVLQTEALTLQRLSHPNIVRVIDCDRDRHTVFMTMEYLTGESLKRKMLRRGFKALPPPEALGIIEKVVSGLAFAHSNGIVHSDLKPGNIHITDAAEVKIVDFGIARLTTRDPGTTIAGDDRPKLIALTPPYASPEMLEIGGTDPRDDIYALACIAHELLTGRHPFDRMVANEARDSHQRLMRSKLLSRSQYRAIAHGLEFRRERRTATADDFLAEFRQDTFSPRAGIGLIAGVLLVCGALGTYWAARTPLKHWISAASHGGAVPAVGELFRDCPTCPLMKVLPAGRFAQGVPGDAAAGTALERPQHSVAIAARVGMSVDEVTVGEFREFASLEPMAPGCTAYDGSWRLHPDLNWSNPGFAQTANHPVVCVSWREASGYARWLSGKTGHVYRLPSESEWEYGARAGGSDTQVGQKGAAVACAEANVADETASGRYPGWTVVPCSDGYVYTAPVGSFKPNAFGLYDMLGNALEWVQDCWHFDYQGAPTDGSAWTSDNCQERVLRGGSWFTAPSAVSATARSRFEDTYRSSSIGFRLVRELKP